MMISQHTLHPSTQHSPSSLSPELSPQHSLAMRDMIIGYWISQMIHVAAKLKLADLLSQGPKTIAQLAQETETHRQSLYRLLRALASVGVFEETQQGTFRLTPIATTLRSDIPMSMRGFAQMMPEDYNWKAWGELLYSVKTGKQSFQHVHKMEAFDYLMSHPEHAKVFGESMTSLSTAENPAIISSFDFSRFKKIVDIGGGHGSLLAGILKANPKLSGVLYDLKDVVERAEQDTFLAAPEIAPRCQILSGSFFESVPQGADAYIMKYILHDWDDERAVKILTHCRHSMAPDATVLVVDCVIPQGNNPSWGKLLDITMMTLTGGCERTEEQFKALFHEAGLTLTRIIPTPCDLSIVEGKLLNT